MYIKKLSDTECECIKLEREENMIVPKLEIVRTKQDNINLFLLDAIVICEDHYLAIYNRLTA